MVTRVVYEEIRRKKLAGFSLHSTKSRVFYLDYFLEIFLLRIIERFKELAQKAECQFTDIFVRDWSCSTEKHLFLTRP